MFFGIFGLAFPQCGPATDDSGTYSASVALTAIEINCDTRQSPDTWTYGVGAVGDPARAQLTTLLLSDTIDLQLEEAHPLGELNFVQDQWFWETHLEVVYEPEDVILGETTELRCADFSSGEMAWRLDIWDSQGMLGYCAIFSTDSNNLDAFENTRWCDVLQLTTQ